MYAPHSDFRDIITTCLSFTRYPLRTTFDPSSIYVYALIEETRSNVIKTLSVLLYIEILAIQNVRDTHVSIFHFYLESFDTILFLAKF